MRAEAFALRSSLTLAMLVMAGLVLVGCDVLGFKNWRWNQKLTVTVQTPDRIVSGSSVVMVTAGTTPRWLPGEGAGGMGSETVGEAAFVELAPGRYLFALLGGERQTALAAFWPNADLNNFEKAERLESLRESRVLSRDLYPRLVTFTDIDAPQTVARVDPDNLAATFGPGYRLHSITLEITDEPATTGRVEALLDWYSGHPEPGMCEPTGRTTNIPFCRRVKHGDFIRR